MVRRNLSAWCPTSPAMPRDRLGCSLSAHLKHRGNIIPRYRVITRSRRQSAPLNHRTQGLTGDCSTSFYAATSRHALVLLPHLIVCVLLKGLMSSTPLGAYRGLRTSIRYPGGLLDRPLLMEPEFYSASHRAN